MTNLDSKQLAANLGAFFHDHLQRARGLSPHTLRAYGQAFRLYLTFLAGLRGRSVDRLKMVDLDAESVAAFVAHIQGDRGNSAATCNARLAALRTFFRYLVERDPTHAVQYSRVLALAGKKSRLRPATYLEPEDVRVILRQPDRRTKAGLRDHTLLLFLYNTGARVGEATALCLEDIEFERPPRVRLRGKGGRERNCPLWRETARALKRLGSAIPPPDGGTLFRNQRGRGLTRDGVAYILQKYVKLAAVKRPALIRQHITPHVLRHSCAVALLQAGVDLTVIRDYLGHASVATTSRYVSVNLDMKRQALDRFWQRAGLGTSRSPSWRPSRDDLSFLADL